MRRAVVTGGTRVGQVDPAGRGGSARCCHGGGGCKGDPPSSRWHGDARRAADRLRARDAGGAARLVGSRRGGRCADTLRSRPCRYRRFPEAGRARRADCDRYGVSQVSIRRPGLPRAALVQDIPQDDERIQNWEEAVESDAAVVSAWREYGYSPITLPFADPATRAVFVLERL